MDSKYYDLHVPRSVATPELIARLLDCEFLYLAVTTTVDIDQFSFTQDDSMRKKSKEDRQGMRQKLLEQLTPSAPETLQNLLNNSSQHRSVITLKPSLSPPRLFRRLQLVCSNTQLAGLFFKQFADQIRAYDVIGFDPMTQEAFDFAIDTNLPVDLISTDLTRISDFRPSCKQCSMCLKKGICFEVKTGVLFRSGSQAITARSGLATLLTHLQSVCQFHFSRLLVTSSGLLSGWEVRRPQAIAAVLRSVGLTSSQGVLAMQQANPYAVLSRGLARNRSTHGAAVLLRLLASPNITSITPLDLTTSFSSSMATTVDENPVNTDSNQLPEGKSLNLTSSPMIEVVSGESLFNRKFSKKNKKRKQGKQQELREETSCTKKPKLSD